MKFRLIPAMMLVASLAFAVRVGDFVGGLQDMGSAHAVEEVKESPPPMNKETMPDEGHKASDAEHADSGHAMPDKANLASGPDLSKTGEKIEWKDSSDLDVEGSQAKADLFKDLAKRRDALDKREKEIGVREALLSAAERELDQKTRELTALKAEIEASLKKRSDEEDARITSLVKIYEGMKPKDAASIFNTLDIDVLLVIMTKMSERKSSPILALMNTDRAKTITTMMAEQQRAPGLPPASN